jgi:hypothetical protein
MVGHICNCTYAGDIGRRITVKTSHGKKKKEKEK